MANNVVTVTLNPTIDKNYFVDRVAPDHKLRSRNPTSDPGGGGINVSKGIKELGGQSTAFFVSGGRTGKYLEDLLTTAGIDFRAFANEEETRESITITEHASNKQYRIVTEGPTVSIKVVDEILDACKKLKPAFLVASGSLPKGLPPDTYARFASLAKSMGSRFVLDTSGDALTAAADVGVFFMKPNLRELSKLAGVEELELDHVDQAAREIINKGWCTAVVVSLGPSGAMLVTDKHFIHYRTPTVKMRSTVGAGDSMVAGIVWGLQSGFPNEDVVAWGVACGTAATMNEGTRLFKKADAEKLFKWVKSH
jgi:6-phosphofructokinase 2